MDFGFYSLTSTATMRLWHEDLISKLPAQQLLGQHRECCALRGRGWGKKHAIVDYIFRHAPYKLYQYHLLIMQEMQNRGYKPSPEWRDPNYRCKTATQHSNLEEVPLTAPIYPEHNNEYMSECIENLKGKGVEIN